MFHPQIRRGDALTASQLHDILQLRVDVFVVEQDCAYPEIDGADLQPDTEHVWIEDDTGVASYVRLLGTDTESPRTASSRSTVRIGRVVTRPDRRGESLSRQLIETVLERLGPIETRLEAQSHLADWYGRLGYRVDGDEYIEDGIPHVPMVRPALDTEGRTAR